MSVDVSLLSGGRELPRELGSVAEHVDAEHLSRVLSATLPTKGLDRMTADRVEFVLCSSALTAHI